MSLFYKNQNKQQPSQNQNIGQQSVVSPYNKNPQQQVPSFYKPTQSRIISGNPQPVIDPTFPQRTPAESRAQEAALRGSILLANNQNDKQSWWSKCCSCTKLQSYQKFFHVTNKDVVKRILMNLQFWSTGFFAPGEQYDFYGPFWIYTTIVFCLTAVANILSYQGAAPFSYNFEIVGLSFGFTYIQGFLFPVILTFILKLLGVECTYIQNVCLYGYSMCAAIICILFCSFNVCVLHLVLLAYAFATKAWFILHNMLSSYAIPIPKKALITVMVGAQAALQFFVIKFFFINCASQQTTQAKSSHLLQKIFYHSRSFEY